MVSAARLNALLDDLDRAGLDAGPSARQQAHMLYMLLASDQRLHDRAAEHKLIDHLRPLIIRSREQDAAFDRVVNLWGHAVPQKNEQAGKTKTQSETQVSPKAVKPPKSFPVPIPWLLAAFAVLTLVFWGLSRWSEPGSVAPIPGPTPIVPGIDDPDAPLPEPITEIPVPGAQAETTIDSGQVFDQDTLEFLFAHNLLQYEFAPTLREFHSTRLFGTLELEDVRRATGLRLDTPVPITEAVILRLAAAAFLPSAADSSFVGDLTPERDDGLWPIDTSRREDIGEFAANADPEFYANFDQQELDEREIAEAERAIYAFAEIEILAKRFRRDRFLESFQGSVSSVSFSNDGTQLVTGGEDGSVIVWSLEDKNRDPRLVTADDNLLPIAVTSAVFSRDDRQILWANADGVAQIVHINPGFENGITTFVATHSGSIRSAEYSNDGTRVVTASFDNTVSVWDAQTGERLLNLEGHEDDVMSARYSPDDSKIVSAGTDSAIRIWDAETGEELYVFDSISTRFRSAVFSNDGSSILISDWGGGVLVFDAEDGTVTSQLEGHRSAVSSASFSHDDREIITAGNDGTFRVWNAKTGEELQRFLDHSGSVWAADFSPDGDHIVSAGDDGNVQIYLRNPPSAWPANEDRVWTVEALAATVRETLKNDLDVELPDDISDATIARQVAALAYQRGDTLRISDAPWLPADWHGIHQPHVVQRHAPLLAALVFVLIGIGAWLWSAFNMRAYLQRRRPGAPGRVIDLFADTRHKADKVQNAIRRAAKALLQRQPGHERLDIKASIKATAKARGLFTPVEKRDTRMPEYLFLIDARSRADHETQRTLDYLERLRKEHVPITHYFYERAPDRVRASMGAPSQSLDLIASEHSDKRLVLVGDAASMYRSNKSGAGAWKKTLESWQSKAFATTVPAAEWGVEEEKFTQETGLVANVLSAEGLEALPAVLFAEGMIGQGPTDPLGALDVPPLPALLRRDPERWVVESAPDEAEWMQLQTALVGYLSIAGWRWLSACAVYPVIEWDLTVALGQVLKDSENEPLYTEALAARLSELPWMRAGEMPDWFRAKLIREIDEIDREAVRELIAKILEAVDSERKSGGDMISLKFGYLQGREPDADERFVDFVTRAPESMDEDALEATRQLRKLLRPNLWKRLIDPGALGWAVIGLVAAVIAWLIAPRYIGVPSHTGAWAPLFTMLVGPVLAWLLWRGGKRVWSARPREGSEVLGALAAIPGKTLHWMTSFMGLTGEVADHIKTKSPAQSAGLVQLLRRRVEVWAMLLLVFVAGFVAVWIAAFFTVFWGFLYSFNDNWLTSVRQTLLGEIILSGLLAIGLYYGVRALWRGLRRLNSIAVRLTNRAALNRSDLAGKPGGRISRTVFLVGAAVIAASLTGTMLVLFDLFSGMSLAGLLGGLTEVVIVFGLFTLNAGLICAWHWWTLRRVARALEADAQVQAEQSPDLKVAA